MKFGIKGFQNVWIGFYAGFLDDIRSFNTLVMAPDWEKLNCHPTAIVALDGFVSDAERAIVIKSSLIPSKTTRTSGGVTLMTMKKGNKLLYATANIPEAYAKGYKKLKIPASGQTIPDSDLSSLQLSIDPNDI